MGLLDRLISWRTLMPEQPDDLARLRTAHYALDELPETLSLSQRPGDEPREPLPVAEATVDEIAFAILEAERECSEVQGRAFALRRLHALAREAGLLGADRAVEGVLKTREGR